MTDQKTLEPWRDCWRRGIAPLLSIANLQALREALAADDPRLVQGATCVPPPLQCVASWPVEAACPLGYMGAMEHGGIARLSRDNYDKEGKLRRQDTGDYATVEQVEMYFARLCFEADKLLGEPATCRYFLNWFDFTPRGEVLV